MKIPDRIKNNVIDNIGQFKSEEEIEKYVNATLRSGQERLPKITDCRQVVKFIMEQIKPR